jgi:hypothetical protein
MKGVFGFDGATELASCEITPSSLKKCYLVHENVRVAARNKKGHYSNKV